MNLYSIYLKNAIGIVTQPSTLGQFNQILAKLKLPIFSSRESLQESMVQRNMIDSSQLKYIEYLNRSKITIFDSNEYWMEDIEEFDSDRLSYDHSLISNYFMQLENDDKFLVVKMDNNYMFNNDLKSEYQVFLSFDRLDDLVSSAKNGYSIVVENDELTMYSVEGNYENQVPWICRYVIRLIDKYQTDDHGDICNEEELFNSTDKFPINEIVNLFKDADHAFEI